MKLRILSLLLILTLSLVPMGQAGVNLSLVKDYTKDPDCVGAWYMNGASSGDETDRSINGETLTCVGAVNSVGVASHDGFTGLARNNFSAARYLYHADGGSTDITTNRITICAWVYRSVATATDIICSKRGASGQYSYQFSFMNSTTLRLRLSTDGTAETGVLKTFSINTLNRWVHVACTYDGTIVSLYMNGNLIGTQSLSSNIFNSTKQFEIGADTTSVDDFTGSIDEFIIFKRSLSQSEIGAIYNFGTDGKKGLNG